MELRIEDLQPIEKLIYTTAVASNDLMNIRPTLTSNDICLCHWPSPRLPEPAYPVPGIDRVIFNAPATIVIWLDGTKTIVKCQPGDMYDEQTGLALCFMKKALDNSSRKFNDILHAYIPEGDEAKEVTENE